MIKVTAASKASAVKTL